MKIISRKQAKAKALKRYFTGEPCKRGHVAERQVSTRACFGCKAVYHQSPKEREAKRRYNRSPKGREVQRRFQRSLKGREAMRRFDQSPKGRERRHRCHSTDAFRNYGASYARKRRLAKAQARYDANPTQRNYGYLMQCRG
jgi:hypothetical protein